MTDHPIIPQKDLTHTKQRRAIMFYFSGHVTAAPPFACLGSRRAEVPPVVVAIIDRCSWRVLDGQSTKRRPEV
jgi:hypothetical protein